MALNPTLKPGDVVVVADGTWVDQRVVMKAHGAEGRPITYRAATPGEVILTGKSSLEINGDWLVVSGFLIKDGRGSGNGLGIQGDHVRLTESAMIGGTYQYFLRMSCAQSRVDHCYFAGKTSYFPTMQIDVDEHKPNHHLIDHNHFGPRPPVDGNGGETMRIGMSGQSMWNSGTTVESNLFDRCDGEIEVISNKASDNLYRWNTFSDCGGFLCLRHGNRCTVDGNFFFCNPIKKLSGGIRIIGEDHVVINNYIENPYEDAIWITNGVPNSALNQYFAAKRCTIAFNTIIASRSACLCLDAGSQKSAQTQRPDGIVVANNVLSVSSTGESLKGEEGLNWKWQGNLAAGRSVHHTGVRSVDPRLVRTPDGLLRPAVDSPLRGAADGDFPAVKTDIDGQPRSGKYDAGCDQVSSAPVINHPLTAADVGPKWLKR